MIPGIDVSHWQREIDWSEVKRSGVKFAFIKATEFPDKRTSLFQDDEMRKNIDGAASNGIFWSAYHFFRTHIDPVIQAKAFCETVGDFSSLPPVLDLEAAGSKGERLNYKVRQFLEETERITNRRPILYSSGGFWRSYMTYEKKEHTNWARAYPLWYAQYTTLWPTPLYPWAGWEFWQYTDKGKIPGVITHVDLNWFNGSVDDLERRFIEDVHSYPDKISITPEKNEMKGFEFDRQETEEKLASKNRGDFQEPAIQKRIGQYEEKGSFQGNNESIEGFEAQKKEEDWIRAYFVQKNAPNIYNKFST